MKMFNTIRNFWNTGTISQSNTTIYDTKIDTSIKRVEKDFQEGNIKQAFGDITSLLKENNANPKIKYQLLVKKTSFLFSVRKYTDAVSLIKNIENHYSKFIDSSFEEIKLIRLSLDKNEKDFFNLVNKIIAESGKPLKKEKFEVMYCLNTGNIQKAKDIFIKDIFEKESIESLLLGGHIFSSLDDFEKANHYYQKALSEDISFLDKHIILSFYSTDIINKHFIGQIIPVDYLKTIKSYQKNIENILTQKEYFEESYIVNLINNYMFTIILLVDDKEKYIKTYEENCSSELIYNYHYFQYARLQKAPINHREVQQKILSGNMDLLLHYIQVLEPDDCNKVVKFLDENIKYIYKSEYIFMLYIKYKLAENSSIDEYVLKYLKEHRFDNIEYLMSFIRVGSDVVDEDIRQLIKLMNQDNLIPLRIIEVIDILDNIGWRKEYLLLTIDNQDKFINTISHTLKICVEDKDLLQNEFDLFVSKINNLDTNYEWIVLIANQYIKFNNYPKAFELYLQFIEEVVNKKDLLFKVMEISINHYIRTKDYMNKEKQKWIYNQLIAQKESMDVNEIIFLFQYSLIVIKDTKQILPHLNQYLLLQDINLLDKKTKIDLSNLYTQTQIGEFSSNYEKLFIYDENISYTKDGESYITNYTVNETNQGVEVLDGNNFFAIKNNPSYKQESLFHRIIGPFAYKVDNPAMIPIQIDMSKDNILEQLSSSIKELFGDEKEDFEAYTNEEFYGLFNLAKKDYANYFTLIPYLLNHDKYRLISLHPNLLVGKKKILTLSSIIFLKDLGYLNKALEREDIYIQQTLINWVKHYIDNFSVTSRPQDFTYLDEKKPKFIPFTQKEVDEAEQFKSNLVALYSKLVQCNIIDDTTESLPIADAYDMLASKMGILEYHAFSYCINHNYQIISENNVFEMLFDDMGYNKLFITNSFSLLANILSQDEVLDIQRKLFEQGYKYLINCPDIDRILRWLYYPKVIDDTNDKLIVFFKILYEYGCLDELIKNYVHKYKVLHPKTILPKEDNFSKNMEKLITLLEHNNEYN